MRVAQKAELAWLFERAAVLFQEQAAGRGARCGGLPQQAGGTVTVFSCVSARQWAELRAIGYGRSKAVTGARSGS